MKNIKKIEVNFITYIYILLLLFSGFKKQLLIITFIFTIHELGHLFFAFVFKIKVLRIKIYPFGGLITFDMRINEKLYKDFFLSIGGILFQLVLLLLNNIFFKNNLLEFYNLMIMLINLLPIIPLDGSKVLLVILCKYISFVKSLIIYEALSVVLLFFLCYFMLINNYLNVPFIMYLVCAIVIDIKSIRQKINMFFMERYLHSFTFKKCKYFKQNNLKLLKREELGYFFENTWKNEKYFLSKKFDISAYF